MKSTSVAFGRLGYVHHFRLESPEHIDAARRTLMREAYRVGTQELGSSGGLPVAQDVET